MEMEGDEIHIHQKPAASRSAGGIVIGEGGTIALVRHQGRPEWLFPKGRLDPGEDDETAARREILEEAGLADLELLADLGVYQRNAMNPDGSDNAQILKDIRMYLFAAQPGAKLAPTMEIEEARWVPHREVAGEIGNVKDRAWYATVFERVREAIQRD